MSSASPPAPANVKFVVFANAARAIAIHAHGWNAARAVLPRSDRAARVMRVASSAKSFCASLRCLAEADDAGDIFGARAAIALVVAAVNLRLERRAGANVERADALRAINLVRGNRKQIHAERDSRRAATFRRTARHRNENKRRLRRRLRQFPRSAESCRVRCSRASR